MNETPPVVPEDHTGTDTLVAPNPAEMPQAEVQTNLPSAEVAPVADASSVTETSPVEAAAAPAPEAVSAPAEVPAAAAPAPATETPAPIEGSPDAQAAQITAIAAKKSRGFLGLGRLFGHHDKK